MRPSSLRHVLRLAALNAVLVPAALAPMACGGSVAADLGLADGGAVDGATPPEDSATLPDSEVPDGGARDVSVPPPDSGEPKDASRDALQPDGACSPPVLGACQMEIVSCLPDGLIVGINTSAACSAICRGFSSTCQVSAVAGGYQIGCLCAVGRFPAGLSFAPSAEPPGTREEDPVGAFLARGAALEASAVRAFEQLARELSAHGAPAALVRRLRHAAREEIRHARLLGAEARARGAKIPRLHARRAPVHARSLYALALENAVEGCGREAIGGALLHVQAARAEDSRLRRVLAELAEDECAHAELSADLAVWLEGQLTGGERTQLAAARRAFFAACADAPPTDDPAVVRALGFPEAAAWRRLVGAVAEGMDAARAAA